MPKMVDIRDFKHDANSKKTVLDTKQLRGTASDSLSGKNSMKEYTTNGSGFSGPYGAKPSRKDK